MPIGSLSWVDIPEAHLAFSEAGDGTPLVCVHGWPFHKAKWAKVAERMKGTCRVPMPGLVDARATDCHPDARFDMNAQSSTLLAFADDLGLERFALMKYDRGGVFHDTARLDETFERRFVRSRMDDLGVLRGQLRYLRGVDWAVVDGLAEVRPRIAAPTLFLWGREHRIVPVEEGRKLPASFGRPAQFEEILSSCLLPYHERPEPFAARPLAFLEAPDRTPRKPPPTRTSRAVTRSGARRSD
jgi:pimeloyl-ACP methyl ester carboxylesterase